MLSVYRKQQMVQLCFADFRSHWMSGFSSSELSWPLVTNSQHQPSIVVASTYRTNSWICRLQVVLQFSLQILETDSLYSFPFVA